MSTAPTLTPTPMRAPTFWTAVLLLAALASAPASRAQPSDFSAVDALVRSSLPELGGGAELLVLQHGAVVFREQYGTWDSTAAVPIASATKWLSAGVLMSLVDEGRLSLDAAAVEYVPSFGGDKAGITVRQLFSHTSGLQRENNAVLNSGTITLAEAADALALVPVAAPPGRDFAYGGVSMQVAGRVAEVAGGGPLPSGAAWDSLFARRIARPLGMRRTDYDLVGGVTPGPTDNPRIAGGAQSTAADYARFLQMLLDGGLYRGTRVLSQAAVDTMLADQTRGARIVASPYIGLSQLVGMPELARTRYGVGVWREVVDTSTGRLLEASCQGAFGFSPWIDVDRDVVAVLAIGGRLADAFPTYIELKGLVRAAVPLTTAAEGTAGPTALSLGVGPNPSRGGARVSFRLPEGGPVRLVLYDLLGREVRVLLDGGLPAGPHDVRLDTAHLPVGLYVLRITAGSDRATARVSVVR